MNYWLDLFTGTTWDEFRASGAEVSGFSHRMRKTVAEAIKPGDILLCYLTGVMRWTGALEVVGMSDNKERIFKDAEFPSRLKVKPLIILDAVHGVPMDQLDGKVAFYRGSKDRGKFQGFIRKSPNRFKLAEDGALVLRMIGDAHKHPIDRKVDPRKYSRKPFFKAQRKRGGRSVEVQVSIPDKDESLPPIPITSSTGPVDSLPETTRHLEIQYRLLKLGSDMGLGLWVARNDRSKTWKGQILGEIAGMVSEIPTQFNDATNRTIELIDALWLRGNSIVAAFEIECTTSIYSGILRMSDLLALQPNLEIRLFIVAPDERESKVEQEILRPTFAMKEKPLHEICGFISFSKLVDYLENISRLGLASALKPDFLNQVAKYFSEPNKAETA